MSIEQYLLSLPPNRQLLASKLLEKQWFKNTDLSIQKSLLSLPDKDEGFLFDLAQKNDQIGSIKLIRLQKIVQGNYLIIPVFETKQSGKNKTFTYEYASWHTGPHSGSKGLLLIEVNQQIKYFVLLESHKFATNKPVFDTVGGLVQYAGHRLINLSDQISQVIKQQLNVQELKISRYYDLGHIHPDAGLSNNYPTIFAAVIDGQSARHILPLNSIAINTKPVQSTLHIIPIEQLDMYLSKVDDSFFHSIISRLLAKKIISL